MYVTSFGSILMITILGTCTLDVRDLVVNTIVDVYIWESRRPVTLNDPDLKSKHRHHHTYESRLFSRYHHPQNVFFALRTIKIP